MPRLTAPARRALVRERRQQILAAAATVFAEKGFDRATISDVARAAGVSDGSIYNYFRDKQDLLVHLPRQFMQTPIEAVQAAIAKPGTPLAAENVLQFAAQNIVNLIIQNREIARVLFTTIPLMDDKLRAEYMRQVPLYAFETLEGFIKAQQAAGVFRADLDPAIAARIFPGMLLAFLLIQEILQPPDMHRFEYDQIIYTVVQVFLRGVTVPEKAAPDIAPKPHTKAKSTPRQARKQEITVE
ncbi:MAG: TetR/AcrR family transcriptional regulator [Chloroflexi bacterium]|nr:TetR/AcrR family transcriptional regulator [Chloroflexota bacterium]